MPATSSGTIRSRLELLSCIYLGLSAQLMNTERLMRIFSALHWLGLAMLLFGIYCL